MRVFVLHSHVDQHTVVVLVQAFPANSVIFGIEASRGPRCFLLKFYAVFYDTSESMSATLTRERGALNQGDP